MWLIKYLLLTIETISLLIQPHMRSVYVMTSRKYI